MLHIPAQKCFAKPQAAFWVFVMLVLVGGCLEERSFPLRERDLVHIELPAAGHLTTRQWLEHAHTKLEGLLGPLAGKVMLTDDMIGPEGRTRDVYRHMGRNKATIRTVLGNIRGTVQTAQCVGAETAIDVASRPWPGFEDVHIPVDEDLSLYGRIGFAEKSGKTIRSNCVIILPGFLGDNSIARTRELAMGLRRSGLHAMALELRGHGQTERHHPDAYYTFGVLDTQDLLKVSRWLQETYACVQGSGLVGFCWGGNLGMLAAWLDGSGPDHPSISPQIARHVENLSDRRHFTAGIIAFSAVIRWESLIDRTDTPHAMLSDPFTHFLQNTVRKRMTRKAYPEVNGNLRLLIDYEFRRSPFGPSLPMQEIYRSLRFLPHRGMPCDDKLESVRTPLLMVHAINDPFLNVQDLADLIAATDNPQVAGLLLPGGGHTGFAAYNRAYYYSLIVNFFDPQTGAATAQRD